jgi:hypothetical protein
LRRIASWEERRDAFSVLEEAENCAALAQRLGLEEDVFERELARREAFLERLVSDGVGSMSAVQEAVDAFRQEA